MIKRLMQNGFTLIELLIALALVSVVGSGFFSVYYVGNNSFEGSVSNTNLQDTARKAMQCIVDDVMQAGIDDSITDDDDTLTIGDIQYTKNNNQLERSSSAVADNISYFNPDVIEYQDEPDVVKLVKVALRVSDGSNSYDLVREIRPRAAFLGSGEENNGGNNGGNQDPPPGHPDFDDGYAGDDGLGNSVFLTSTVLGNLYICDKTTGEWSLLNPDFVDEDYYFHHRDVNITDLVSNGTQVVAVGQGGQYDGNSINGRTSILDNDTEWGEKDNALFWSDGLNAVTWSEPLGCFVTVGKSIVDEGVLNNILNFFGSDADSGIIYTSTDGEEWDASTATLHELNDVFWGGDKFISVGNDGSIYTGINSDLNDGSIDIDWIEQTSTTEKNLNGVVYSPSNELTNKWVTVGNDGTLLVSNTGITWSAPAELDLPDSPNFNDIVWGTDRYLAVGDNGTMVSSEDGNYWTKVNLSQVLNVEDDAGNSLVAVSIQKVSCANGIYIATLDASRTKNGNPLLLQFSTDEGWLLKEVTSLND
ncbi:MAG: prepilin-type N-terminal cleavage/methylation domain-containing protein [Bacillota bacterium]|nr:prepilin-type N-terminal cleavage/methylation domain-containing protein [Bacillota bacterium]